MANKFQKSVMERIEQETARRSKRTRSEATAGINGKLSSMSSSDTNGGPVKEDTSVMPEDTRAVHLGMDEYLRRDTLRQAKKKTVYLDADLIDAIRKTARREGVTDSKLANDILRHVLGL